MVAADKMPIPLTRQVSVKSTRTRFTSAIDQPHQTNLEKLALLQARIKDEKQGRMHLPIRSAGKISNSCSDSCPLERNEVISASLHHQQSAPQYSRQIYQTAGRTAVRQGEAECSPHAPPEKFLSDWKMTPFPHTTSIGDPQSIARVAFVSATRGEIFIADTEALPPFSPMNSIRRRPFETAAAVVRLKAEGV
jgi:hypothetical protein